MDWMKTCDCDDYFIFSSFNLFVISFWGPKTKDAPNSPGLELQTASFFFKSWLMRGFLSFFLSLIHSNGIDVDRFDYMVRDCYHVVLLLDLDSQLGLHCSYNYDNILQRSRCIKNEQNQWEICFNYKVFYDLCDMFQCRLNLCRRAYLASDVFASYLQHPSCRIIERMLIEAFQIAESHGVGIRTSVQLSLSTCSS